MNVLTVETIVLITILATGLSDLLHPFWRGPSQSNFNNMNGQWSPSSWPAPVNCAFSHVDLTNAPVCGSDGNTYLNQDAIRRINCKKGNQDILVKYKGICKKDCGDVDFIYSPVCGSNNITYVNADAIKQINCKNDLYGSEEIEVKHPGICKKKSIQDQSENQGVNKAPDNIEVTPLDHASVKDTNQGKQTIQDPQAVNQDLAKDHIQHQDVKNQSHAEDQESVQNNASLINTRRRMHK